MTGGFFFFVCLGLLIAGYFVYGTIVEKIFRPDENRPTPAKTAYDGMDFVEMPQWKVLLIQAINISALGPVFGPILGALYGPVALLWIVFGCIFAGAVHDYFSGMMPVRYKSKTIPEVVGANLGDFACQLMRYFSILVLILVSVYFATVPAGLLNTHFSLHADPKTGLNIWLGIIFTYYFLATMTPIDKFIGRIYPVLGLFMLFFVVSLPVVLFAQGYNILPNLDFTTNTHTSLPIWPMLFITIACGAISGFHSTQSPLMAACIANEKQGRKVFYGAMVIEGVIALIWVTIGLSFYGDAEGLRSALLDPLTNKQNPGLVVTEACKVLLGTNLGLIALIGMILLPITSGDTALRSALLTITNMFDIPPHKFTSRLMIIIPMLIIGGILILSKVGFDVIWRYFGWANQTLAMIMLWAAAVYLAKRARFHWICTVPATFMTAVTVTYLCFDKIGFGMPYIIANCIGIGVAIACLVLFLVKGRTPSPEPLDE